MLDERLRHLGESLDDELVAISPEEVSARLTDEPGSDRPVGSWWLVTVAAVLVVVGLVMVIERQAGESTRLTDVPEPSPPVEPEPTSPPLAFGDAFSWSDDYPAAPAPWPGLIASNGRSFLAIDPETREMSQSVDLGEWVPTGFRLRADSQVFASADGYLVSDGHRHPCTTCWAWRSEDGVEWGRIEVQPPGTMVDAAWYVSDVDTVAETSLEGANEPWAVVDFGRRLVAYSGSSFRRVTLEPGLRAFESLDGVTWFEVAAPPWAEQRKDWGYLSPLCAFAFRDHEFKALIPHDGQYSLWSSSDGRDWTETTLNLNYSEYTPPNGYREPWSSCIHSLDDGWLISPRSSATIGDLRLSLDGTSWEMLEAPPEYAGQAGMVGTAANTVFIGSGPSQLVGRIHVED